ncbi:hypothetical protein RI129_010557 [Pyrocoelia pectoralis]|uniref:Uncharacterized protein n=1 Tax=Pyrocoelia pectoralis TaxID=417401 RepID=A0AAN7V6F7_9COLE
MQRSYLTVIATIIVCCTSLASTQFEIKGKIALVTGGSRGIGFSIASELLRNGVKGLTIVGISVDRGRAAAKSLNEQFGPGKAIFIPADVGDMGQLENAFKISIAHWNGLDIIINNAGILNDVNWTVEINTNIVGTLQGTSLGLKYMRKNGRRRGGVIINISSIFGIAELVYAPVYSGTKSFIVTLGRALSHSAYYDYNKIRVITLCPGFTRTDLLDRVVLFNGTSDTFKPGLKEMGLTVVDNTFLQTAENVGRGAITVLEEGANGSVWIVDDEQPPYEIEFPKRQYRRRKPVSPSVCSTQNRARCIFYGNFYNCFECFQFKDKVALITGGTRGIGYVTARELLSNGVKNVALVDYNVEKGREAEKMLNEAFGSGRVIFVPADVTNLGQFDNAFKVTLQHWNNLDIVVNNAGVSVETNWNRIVNINIRGTIYGTLLGFKYMSKSEKAKGGIIVNISSYLAINPMIYVPVYDSTKSFVLGLSRALDNAIYYNHSEVRVITLCPGSTDTEMFSNIGIGASNSLNPRIKEMTNDVARSVKTQSADAVGKGVISAIEEESNGNVWVVEDYEYYNVVFPDRLSMKKETLRSST